MPIHECMYVFMYVFMYVCILIIYLIKFCYSAFKIIERWYIIIEDENHGHNTLRVIEFADDV